MKQSLLDCLSITLSHGDQRWEDGLDSVMQDRKIDKRKEKLELPLHIRHNVGYVFWIYVIYTISIVDTHTNTHTQSYSME